MPTVEDYFDDDTDLPLPSSSRGHLSGAGLQGALVEEIRDDDDVDNQLDYDMLAEQSRGVFGENSSAPPAQSSSNNKGKLAVRGDGELRPSSSGQPAINPNTPMGGFMGDMMRMQAAEDERLEKLRKQFGNATVATDPSIYKGWNTVYPIYFDAKVSINDGRRVPRTSSLWWPQATQISQACKGLGLPSVLEPDRVHPADWENPGRVKVQFVKDGQFLNPIVTNRAQLYKHLADQLRQRYPSVAYTPNTAPSKRSTKAAAAKKSKAQSQSKKDASKSKSQSKKTGSTSTTKAQPRRLPTQPPSAPQPVPALEARLPLHSPVVATGVALASVKRDKEAEKENKKKGITSGPGAEEGKEKMPKMKRVVVRGKR